MRDQLPHRYDHAWLLGQIVDGYYRTEMSTTRRDTDDEREEHLREQADRARAEDRFARDSDVEGDERAHRRRADRAAYLRDKLAEAERSERSA
ncbi:hypothetical protein [Conexibacter woesei]|uniref:hypothetical protein n=1 Tax=Conexibacter woesei TaxID=191495 RepID=UPI0004036AD2|nr:hypothetical protein [Conexibacter woesei]